MTSASAAAPLVDAEDRALPGGGTFVLLWLNRPEQRNPLDLQTIRALREELAKALARREVRVVGLTGRGPAFSAGGDVAGYVEAIADEATFTAVVDTFHALVRDLAQAAVPTIAVVNGIAVAGGLEVLLACDMAVAAAGARLGDAHQNVAMIGGGGALSLLPRVIGPARTADLVFTGRMLRADEALAWGLVSRVVPDSELLATADAMAAAVAARSSVALQRSKRVLRWVVGSGAGTDAAMALEREATVHHATTSADAREGVAAFAAKRTPHFTGS